MWHTARGSVVDPDYIFFDQKLQITYPEATIKDV